MESISEYKKPSVIFEYQNKPKDIEIKQIGRAHV